MRRSIKIADEKRKYFEDLDRSILSHSVQHSRLELEAEAARAQLRTLYQSRQNHLNQQLQEAGIDPLALVGAGFDQETGEIVVELRELREASAPPPNAS